MIVWCLECEQLLSLLSIFYFILFFNFREVWGRLIKPIDTQIGEEVGAILIQTWAWFALHVWEIFTIRKKGKNRAFIWRNAFVEAFPSWAGCGRGPLDLPICKMNGYLNSFPNNFSFLPNLSKPKRRVIINFLLGNSDSYHLSRTSSHMNFNVHWKNKW